MTGEQGMVISACKIRRTYFSEILADVGPGFFQVMERKSHEQDIILTFDEAEKLAKYITDKLELHKRQNHG